MPKRKRKMHRLVVVKVIPMNSIKKPNAGLARGKGKSARTSIGRRPLNVPVINICDALHACSSIAAAARELKCSRGYIHKELAKYGVTPGDVIKGRW